MGDLHVFGVALPALAVSGMSWFARARIPKVPHYVSSIGFAISLGLLMPWIVPNLRPGTWIAGTLSMVCLAFAVEWQLAAPTSVRAGKAPSPPSPEAPKPPPAPKQVIKQVGVNLTVAKPASKQPAAPPPAPAPKSGDTYTNNGVNNGIMGPVTIGKPEFQLTDELMQSVLDAAPKGVPVVVRSVGGSRATDMGNEIAAALRAQDYDVRREMIGVMSPPPEQPLSVRRGPTTTVVTIDPAA